MPSPKLNLVVIRSGDIERAAVFYQTLGLALDPEKHGTGPRHYAAQLGELAFEVYPTGSRPRLGFWVVSLADTLAALDNTTPIVQGPMQTERGNMAVVEDPDHHRIELIEDQDLAD